MKIKSKLSEAIKHIISEHIHTHTHTQTLIAIINNKTLTCLKGRKHYYSKYSTTIYIKSQPKTK